MKLERKSGRALVGDAKISKSASGCTILDSFTIPKRLVVLEGCTLAKDITTLHNNTQDAFTIPDQRSAGIHSPSLGTISVLRPNVQPPATATTTKRRLGLGLVPAAIRRRYELVECYQVNSSGTNMNLSPLRQVPLPTHSQLRALPAPLPLRIPRS
jgi:hypothetical protein